MQSIRLTVLLLCLLLTAASASHTGMAHGTELLTDDLPEICDAASCAVTLEFGANITTGYEWYAYIVSGESVTLQDQGYVSDPNP